MHGFDVVWHGTVVGRLTNVEAETILAGVEALAGEVKCEGDFVAAPGAVAAEFSQRLQALQRLDVTTSDDRTPRVIYWRGKGRAKVAWNSTHPGQ